MGYNPLAGYIGVTTHLQTTKLLLTSWDIQVMECQKGFDHCSLSQAKQLMKLFSGMDEDVWEYIKEFKFHYMVPNSFRNDYCTYLSIVRIFFRGFK